jgi:MFS family permease
MTTPAQPLSFREVLRLTSFRRLWFGQMVSLFGDFLAIFAVLTVATYRFHGTPAQVTMISIAFMIPFAFIGPIAGVFVDRWNLKRTMVASDLIRAGLALLLIFTANLNGIYVILLLLSTVSTFFIPAQSVTLRAIVPPHGLLAANALMQQIMQVIRIISPALAGTMVATLGEQTIYLIDSASFLFSAAMIASIVIEREQSPTNQQSNTVGSILAELGAGMKFIFTHASISFVMISIAAGMFAISSFGPLIAVYVRDYLHASEAVFGVINTLIGVGMIIGTFCINRFAATRSKSRLVVEGLLGIGLSVALMAAFTNIPVAALGNFGIGFGAAFIMIPSQTLIQQETPMELVGRVSSSVWSLLSVAQLFGLALSGSLAQKLGIITLFYLSAALLALIAIFGHFHLQNKAQVSSEPQEPQQAPEA